jgi:FlaA1/EpsC-like NDP-sugar epimerase
MAIIHTHNPDFNRVYRGKTIFITGSVGTVGSELLKQIIEYRPKEIRLFDNSESGLHMQTCNYGNAVKILPALGDIRDSGKLHSVMDGVDVVFHLAAYKHVFLCECNPFDSVRTNVIGTQNVLKAALDAKVNRVLYTSSDKAVNPTNVMGTSKLLAERVVTAMGDPFFQFRDSAMFWVPMGPWCRFLWSRSKREGLSPSRTSE